MILKINRLYKSFDNRKKEKKIIVELIVNEHPNLGFGIVRIFPFVCGPLEASIELWKPQSLCSIIQH